MAGTTEARPRSLSPRALAIAGWVAFLVAGFAFFTLAWNVAAHDTIVDIDLAITRWLASHRLAPLTAVMLAVTHANSLAAIGLWSAAFAAILWRMGERYWILTVVAAVAGGMILNGVLKVAYERARPGEQPLRGPDTALAGRQRHPLVSVHRKR